MKVVVIGASGKSGGLVTGRLCDLGHEVTAVTRDLARLDGLDPRADTAVGDLPCQSANQ